MDEVLRGKDRRGELTDRDRCRAGDHVLEESCILKQVRFNGMPWQFTARARVCVGCGYKKTVDVTHLPLLAMDEMDVPWDT